MECQFDKNTKLAEQGLEPSSEAKLKSVGDGEQLTYLAKDSDPLVVAKYQCLAQKILNALDRNNLLDTTEVDKVVKIDGDYGSATDKTTRYIKGQIERFSGVEGEVFKKDSEGQFYSAANSDYIDRAYELLANLENNTIPAAKLRQEQLGSKNLTTLSVPTTIQSEAINNEETGAKRGRRARRKRYTGWC